MDLGTMELYDGINNEFIHYEVGVVRFEYSLKALYEWEAKWKKPFLTANSNGELSNEELLDFYKMMALDPIEEESFTDDVMVSLSEYIGDSTTATTFHSFDKGQNGNNNTRGKVYTAEELYAMMIMANVPLEFENRNLNRLLVILRVISSYNNPPKKMTQQDIMQQNKEINAKRKAQFKTKG
jgi:hypothetical protein